jgi:hypothetical protein
MLLALLGPAAALTGWSAQQSPRAAPRLALAAQLAGFPARHELVNAPACCKWDF